MYKLDDTEVNVAIYSPSCFFCKHLIGEADRCKTGHCKAFKDIPVEIWNGDNDHKKPYPGDHGIQFEER